MAKKRKLTTKDAVRELWNRGELKYKLKGKQHELYDTFKQSKDKVNVICSSRRLGKCLSSGTKVLTPKGLKFITDLKPGEEVYGYNENGTISPCKVRQVMNNGPVLMYDLVHNNKVLETCSLDHQWLVKNRRRDRDKSIRINIKEKRIRDFVHEDKIVRIFTKAPMGDVDYPHAYVLGALLGDGCSREGVNDIHISGGDEEIIAKCAEDLGVYYKKQNVNNFTWVLSRNRNPVKGRANEKLTFDLYDKWCRGRYAHEKIVDIDIIKTWNRASQLKLLAGLIDTDGSVIVTKKDHCLNIQFSMQALSIVEAFKELTLQLFQYNPSIIVDSRDKYVNGPVYEISIKNNLFCKRILKELDPYIQTPRKKWKPEYEDLRENNTCRDRVGVKFTNPRVLEGWDIEIDNETHMYLTANGLVTHNSTVMCCLALETCVKKPGSIVKYASATQRQVSEILDIVMKPLLEDCPAHLRPEWKEAKKKFEFPNGSQLQIAATEKGHIENLRGSQADLALVDEAGFATNLDYVVQNILVPATATTKGKIILCSTPNYEDPQHPFNVDYLLPREAAGTLKKFTIYDAPMLDEQAIQDTIEAYGGIDNPRFRCEFLAEIAIDLDTMVFPELNQESERCIVQDVDPPAYFDCYVSMDIGFKDLTAVLFAYYDYLKETVVILDELVINGPDLTTDNLAELIKKKEAEHFVVPKFKDPIKPTLRVADNNNPILLNDLYRLHGLSFVPTAKDNKFAQVNEVKLRLRQNKIIIHPRCKNLLYQMKSLKWDKKRKGFMRIRGNKEKGYPASHGDSADSLTYLIRNIITTKNPYPHDYFDLKGENVWRNRKNKVDEAIQGFMDGLMGRKKK